ncbi:MAG: bifunctional DNA-formamidopyrimidine glycosylase/DNA-(apurinic or apyrimidinic site) lyase [Fidelibacterota bacterium]|nr:MAG: bifunctional DNA-formamidopyrimidine glycosylase/DNA-(apurinic or apyrimidinic site) lyase [Candidatus Neomarinimicrobiota bacterium]
MPELPEVETVVRYLRPHLEGRTVNRFEAWWPKVTDPMPAEVFAQMATNRVIHAIHRRGKYILWQLDRGFIHIHLRMTGQLVVLDGADNDDRHHVTAEFDLSDEMTVLFRDMRKFGRVGYLEDIAPLEAKLGPEPLSPQFTPDLLHRLLADHRRQIKPLLLDQGFIAGLGNIYVDEALFLARVHPGTPASSLTLEQAQILHHAIQGILTESIGLDGTTIINFSFGDGGRGRFRDMLQVFRREGEPCPVCGTPLEKIRIAQRGTHLCPQCQVLDS